MTRQGWWTCLVLGLSLWLAIPDTAWGFQMFPTGEMEEAHALRRRILSEIPQLDPKQLRETTRLSPETLALAQQRLAVLQVREAENPFFHWAQGEVLRQTQGPAAATAAFERARQRAGKRVLIHWLLWQDLLGRDLREEAQREERALQAIQLSWGLARFPLLAMEESRLAAEAADRGDLPRAVALYDAAVANAPESPELLIGRAGVIWQADKTRLVRVVLDLAAGLFHSVRAPRTGFRLTSNLLLSLLIAWLATLCLVGTVFSIRTHRLLGHELSEHSFKRLAGQAQANLGLLLLLLPLLLGLGLLWTVLVALLISVPYMTRGERATVSILLAGLLVLPFGYGWVADRHVLASSQRFGLVQAVERGERGETLVRELQRWAAEATNAGLPRYYLGLVLKRRGEVARAEAELAQAARLLPRAGFALVGLGNIQYLLGRLPEAEATYRRAAETSPASAAVHLNLSRLYVQRLQLDLSNEALTRSLKLDPYMARTISYANDQGNTRFVLDEPVPWGTLAASLAPQIEDVHAAAEGFWGAPLRGVSLVLLPYVAGLCLILFWVHGALRGRTPPVRRCPQCGTPFCGKCQKNPKEKEYCGPCALVFRQGEGITAFARVRRIREAEEWQRRQQSRIGVLGSVIPGGSDMYTGRIVQGFLLCLPAVWLLAEGVVLDAVTPSLRFASPLPGPIRVMVALLLLGALYLYSARRGWRSVRGIR
jgi:tetratricopeptide (TPR) repeat protein